MFFSRNKNKKTIKNAQNHTNRDLFSCKCFSFTYRLLWRESSYIEGFFAPKILKILKTVKNGEKRDFLPRKKINRFQKRAGFSRAKMGGLA